MINKLLSSLPYNPSLIDQVAFYSRRLKKEESVRRLGFIMVALSMLIQLFAATFPAERSLAYSDNHIINGVKTRKDILRAWDARGSDIPAIYGKFGVTRQDIANLPQRPNDRIRSDQANYWSIGRNSLSGYSNIAGHFKNKEIALGTDSGTTIYMRPLHAWDTRGPYSTYSAFRGRNSTTGETFWILVDCGNYAQIGKKTLRNPALSVRKTIKSDVHKLKPGDSYTFRIEYRNTRQDSLAEDVVIKDNLDIRHFEVVSPSNLNISRLGNLRLEVGNLSYSRNPHVVEITVRLKQNLPSGTTVCNAVRLTSSNAGSVSDGGGPRTCVQTYNPCPFNPLVPDDGEGCKEPVADCVATNSIVDPKTGKTILSTTINATDKSRVKIKKYSYDFGDGSKKEVASSQFRDVAEHTYKSGEYLAKVSITYEVGGTKTTTKTAACSAPIEISQESPPGLFKRVKNITQNLEDEQALSALVHPGDVVEYSLVTANTQGFEKTGQEIRDYVGDLLDYSTLDLKFLAAQGGSFDEKTKTVTWSNQTLPAGSDTVKKFRIIMKNPIPSTNSPSKITTAFDCKISNQYGNELSLDVQCPVLKTVEQLPNTGPGAAVGTAFAITVVSGYFFARSRLLAKELAIVRKEYLISAGS